MHDPKHVNVKGIQVLFSNHHEVLILKSETNYQILCYLSSLQTRAYHLRKIPFIAYAMVATECKIGLLHSIAMHITITTCDTCPIDHMVRALGPSPSIFAYCKHKKLEARMV